MSLRALHYALVAAMVVPLAAMLAYTIWSDSENLIAHARSEVRVLAQITAADTGRTVITHKEMLRAMAKRPRMRALDAAKCDPLLFEFHQFLPRFANFATVDRNGIAVCSAVPQPGDRSVSLREAEWFKRGMAEERFLAGKPFFGPITGRWVSVLAYPLHDESGTLTGLLALPLDLANYEPNVSAAKLAAGTTVGLLTGDGMLVWRNQAPEQWIGKDVREIAITRALLASRSGDIEGVGVDGVRRYYAAARVPEVDWVAYAGVPVAETRRQAIAGALRNSVLGLIVLSVIVFLASRIARRIAQPIRSLAGAARQIRSGHTEIRAPVEGPAEVAEVATEFNEMVNSRLAAEAALHASMREVEALYNRAPCGYHSCGPQGVVLRINDTELGWLGCKREDVVGKKRFSEFLGPSSRVAYANAFRLVKEAGEVRDLELNLVRADGSFLPVLVSAVAVRDATGGFVMTRAAVYDMSQRKKLEESMEATIAAMASTVELRDRYTAGHQRRVSQLSEALAREMGLAEERVHGIRLAGMVHDLGQVQIPAEILARPGRLSPLEFEFIKGHPQGGYDILKEIEFPWPIAEVVKQHHERLDGSGYPAGLRGEQILLEARIIAVADVVEAMASHRPYRPALGIEAALEEIERKKGTRYDAEVVEACLKLFRESRFAFKG